MIAHTLGNPFNLSEVLAFCQQRNLWLIEDNCDALGSEYTMPASLAQGLGYSPDSADSGDGQQVTKMTGSWGDISTQSFYPPHHLTI